MPPQNQDQALLALDEDVLQSKSCKSLASWKSILHEPLPDDVDEAALDRIESVVRTQITPATNAEVIGAVKRLRLHYGEWSQLTQDEEADIWRDWLLDFKAYPKGLLIDACAAWRNSEAKKAPSPGQLKALVKNDMARLRHLEMQAGRARRALKDDERVWRS